MESSAAWLAMSEWWHVPLRCLFPVAPHARNPTVAKGKGTKGYPCAAHEFGTYQA